LSTSSLLLQHGDTELNEDNWKSFVDELSETLELPSIIVPAQHVHWLLSNKDSPIKPYLATQMIELEGVHPKIKVVRDCAYEKGCDDDQQPQRLKRILLGSHLALGGRDIDDDTTTLIRNGSGGALFELTQQLPGLPEQIVERLVNDFEATPGKPECIHISYQNQPITRILSKMLPPEAQPPPSSYEQIGHVAHVNLRQPHLSHKRLIGRVMLDRLQPSIRTVVNKLGEVGGPYRTYQIDLIAGDDDYFVHVIEHGVSLFFDLRKVYWCTRLEGERTYMIQNEFQPNQLIADAFCGVGALCIRAATGKGCRVLANDLNPDAVEYCKGSAGRNGIDICQNGKFQVQCGDASQFIMNLGMGVSESSTTKKSGVSSLPDHLLLNFPSDSPSFLNALRWWPSGGQSESSPRVHVYTFARGDEERTAAEVAIDMVADGLLPEGGYVEPSMFRGEYLNELGCNIQAREIRDAAPGKLVICVSFNVTRLLLRRMQGDYGLE
jgi:tRNA (guanine37-N1)-methyltransferase